MREMSDIYFIYGLHWVKTSLLNIWASRLLLQLFLYKAILQRQDIVLKKVFWFSAGQASSWLYVTDKPKKYIQYRQLTREAGSTASKAEQK